MNFFIKPFGSVKNLENFFNNNYERWIILGKNHEAIFECYSIECSNNYSLGLGVAVAIPGVLPKALQVEQSQAILVGFDSFIASVFPCRSDLFVENKTLRLDAVFFDMILFKDIICIIHELGAVAVSVHLEKIWSFSTDIISSWGFDVEHGLLTLIELDSDIPMKLSIETGEKV